MRNVSLNPAPGPVCPPGPGWVVWLFRTGVSLSYLKMYTLHTFILNLITNFSGNDSQCRRLCVYVGIASRGYSWSETLKLCRERDPRSELVSVHSRAESRELFAMVEAGLGDRGQGAGELTFWLGALRRPGGWAWGDGTQWSWAAWLPGQPSLGDTTQMCAKTRRVRGVAEEPYWYDIDCDNRSVAVSCHHIGEPGIMVPRYGEHKVFVCTLDKSDTEDSEMEMWHNVATLCVLGCGAILIVICLVKCGLGQLYEDSPVIETASTSINTQGGGKGDRHFVPIQEVQASHYETVESCVAQLHCCDECGEYSDQLRDDGSKRSLKRMSNIESKIMKKKSRD